MREGGERERGEGEKDRKERERWKEEKEEIGRKREEREKRRGKRGRRERREGERRKYDRGFLRGVSGLCFRKFLALGEVLETGWPRAIFCLTLSSSQT